VALSAVLLVVVTAPVPRVRIASRLGTLRRVVGEDLRNGVLRDGAWQGIAVASTVAMAGHVATYFLAARAVGVTVSVATLLPLAVLVLVAAGLPVNLAGWGPREGMAAWVFGAAGLGVHQGVATATAYGAIVLVASLPGAVVLVVAAARRAAARSQSREDEVLAGAGSTGGGGHDV